MSFAAVPRHEEAVANAFVIGCLYLNCSRSLYSLKGHRTAVYKHTRFKFSLGEDPKCGFFSNLCAANAVCRHANNLCRECSLQTRIQLVQRMQSAGTLTTCVAHVVCRHAYNLCRLTACTRRPRSNWCFMLHPNCCCRPSACAHRTLF